MLTSKINKDIYYSYYFDAFVDILKTCNDIDLKFKWLIKVEFFLSSNKQFAQS